MIIQNSRDSYKHSNLNKTRDLKEKCFVELLHQMKHAQAIEAGKKTQVLRKESVMLKMQHGFKLLGCSEIEPAITEPHTCRHFFCQ